MENATVIFARTIRSWGQREAYNVDLEEFKALAQQGSCTSINQSDGIAYTHETIYHGKKFMASSEHEISLL